MKAEKAIKNLTENAKLGKEILIKIESGLNSPVYEVKEIIGNIIITGKRVN